MKDVSHGLNKVFEKSLKAIPKEIQSTIRTICSHFNRSTQKCALLRDIIITHGMKPLEILQLPDTR